MTPVVQESRASRRPLRTVNKSASKSEVPLPALDNDPHIKDVWAT